MTRFPTLFLAIVCAVSTMGAARAEGVHVLAAGSLREVVGEIGARYKKATGIEISADFGPSGVLRERIEKGERADLFASADMGHPLKLLTDGRATRVAMFTRNALCGFAVPKVGLTGENFLERLLDPQVKLGASTPNSDPSGDYTWIMFRRAEAIRPGSYAVLDRKAQKIVGGPNTPATGNPVAGAFASGKIDVMIGYCSGRQRMLSAVADLQIAEAPKEIATGPEYGLAILKGAGPRAGDFALYILSPEGQQVLAQFDFAPVGLPTPEPQ